MSKRKGGKHKTERVRVNLPKKVHERYEKELKKKHRKGLNLVEMIDYFMDVHLKYDFYGDSFYEFIQEDKKRAKTQKTQSSIEVNIGDDRCKGLVKRVTPGKEDDYLDKVDYICVKGSLTGPVKLKKLGGDPTKICIACKNTLNLEERWAQIRSKDKLGVEEHTYCKDGGWYDDKTGRIHCKKMNRWMDQNVCFTIGAGRPCPSLKTLPARRVKRTGIQRRKR